MLNSTQLFNTLAVVVSVKMCRYCGEPAPDPETAAWCSRYLRHRCVFCPLIRWICLAPRHRLWMKCNECRAIQTQVPISSSRKLARHLRSGHSPSSAGSAKMDRFSLSSGGLHALHYSGGNQNTPAPVGETEKTYGYYFELIRNSCGWCSRAICAFADGLSACRRGAGGAY